MNFKKINKTKVVNWLSIIIIFVAMLVMVGWFFDIEILKSILPFWVTMKFTTAFSFFLSGLILYFANHHQRGNKEISNIVLPLCTTLMFLIMGTLLFSVFAGVRTGLEDLFVQEEEGAIQTTTPGRPSIGTMINFIAISILSFFTLFHLKKMYLFYSVGGRVIASIGLVAIIGYLIGVPELYYAIEEISTAMAFHTAILFFCAGLGLRYLG